MFISNSVTNAAGYHHLMVSLLHLEWERLTDTDRFLYNTISVPLHEVIISRAGINMLIIFSLCLFQMHHYVVSFTLTITMTIFYLTIIY